MTGVKRQITEPIAENGGKGPKTLKQKAAAQAWT